MRNYPACRFAAIFMLTLLLAACASKKPEAVVEQFYRAAAKGDVEEATKQVSFTEVPADVMVQAKGKVQIIIGEMQNRVQTNEGLDKIEIVNVTVNRDEKTAVVESKVVFKNGKSMTEKHHLIQTDDGWKLRLH